MAVGTAWSRTWTFYKGDWHAGHIPIMGTRSHADEIFASGSYSKVMPVNRIDERALQPRPLSRKARALYWDFAHA